MTLGDLPAFALLFLACAAFLRWGCVRDDETSPDHHAGSTGEARRASSTGGPGACRQCEDVR